MGRVLIAGTAALLICIFLSPKFIEFLRNREFGQNIREEGPEGHHSKAGTPTMGGIIIFAAIAIPFLILSSYDWRSVGVFGAAVASAVLGFADDYTKIIRRRSLGLRGRTKLLVTVAISLGLWWVATEEAGLSNELRLRIVDYQIDLGIFYPVLIYLVVAGTTSAVNLTDGLDGLAAGCAAIVLLAFIGITFITTGQRDLALLSSCLVGGCIGFLWFNSFPAQIAATIQKRRMIFVSDHPASSKWWWIGAIRNTRLRNDWKLATWISTDSASITKMPPITIRRISVLVTTASAAIAPPRPSDPVSPMNTDAGNELNHRKPTLAPTRQALRRARSS